MDDKRMIVIKRLRKARTCLSYWEIEILLNYINELEEKKNAEVQKADCPGVHG